MKKKFKKTIGILLVISMAVTTLMAGSFVSAKDYTDGGCVQWVKDRAQEKLGITLPATGTRPTGKYAALNYWTILPEQGYTKSSTPRQDALAIWDGGIGSYAGYGHVAYVEEVSGNQVYLSEGGFAGGNQGNGVNKQWWNAGNLNRPKAGQTFLGYIYLTGSAPAGLTYTEIKTEFVDTWNAGLYGYIDNPGRISLSAVGAYVWDEAGNLVVNHREECTLSTPYVKQQLNIVGEALPTGLRQGASYTYQLYAVAGGTEYKSAVGSFTILDDQKPTITNVTISNQSETGYTVSCTVTDNYQVDRVQFPTWTVQNGQDDIAADWGSSSSVRGTKNGDRYTFRVNISDHNNEKGTYCTHIYAYDKAGNYLCVPAESVEIRDSQATAAPGNVAKPGVANGSLVPQPANTPFVTSNSEEDSPSAGSVGGTEQKRTLVKEPERVKIKKLKKAGKGCAKITWKKVKCNDGYQIQYSRKRSFLGKKTTTSYSKSTYIYGKSKKTYYVRVRAVNRGWTSQSGYGGKYGKWSKVRKIRLK